MRALAKVGDALLIIAAVVIAVVALRNQFWPRDVSAQLPAPVHIAGAAAMAQGGALLGPADARVRLVEFSDFQCPFCANATVHLQSLRRKYPTQRAVVYRYFPLRGHPEALPAAIAAECAHRQHRFEAYHDILFAQQESIGLKSWSAFAIDAKVPDLPTFSECVAQRQTAARVDSDLALARSSNLAGTPSFILGDLNISGPNAARLEWFVDSAVSATAEGHKH